MKKVRIETYIQGLASFLDEENIEWEQVEDQIIEIYYHSEEELFRIGWMFGQFYEKII